MQDNFEHFSAAHDGEGNAQDMLRLLDAIDNDPERRNQDSLYYLIGDALRDRQSPTLAVDVTSAVMRAVAREPVPAIPADATVRPFRSARLPAQVTAESTQPDQSTHPVSANSSTSWWQGLSRTAAAVAAVAFISGLVWRGTGVSDPVVAYVVFEQPRSAPQVVQMDTMPAELVDYLLAHRQNTVAGSMNVGSALIRANIGESIVSPESAQTQYPQTLQQGRAGDMEWVRLWDNRPVYVTPRAVER